MRTSLLPLLVLTAAPLLGGCPVPVESSDLELRLATLEARVPTSIGDDELLATGAEVEALRGELAALKDDVLALTTRVDTCETELADLQAEVVLQGESYATDEEVASQIAALDGTYATDADVASQIAALDGTYATDADVAGQFAALDGTYATDSEVAVALASYVTNTSLVTTLADYATIDYADGEVFAEGETRAAADTLLSDRLDAVEGDYLVATDLDDVVHVLSTDTTWSVATESELEDAIAALDSYHIAADATVTIEIAAGDYYFSDALRFHHPDGGRIAVVGDTTYPNNVNLYFLSGSHGIIVDEGSALGYIGGLSLHGGGLAGTTGVYVWGSSSAKLGPAEISDFGGYGVAVTGSSYLEGDSTSTLGWLTVDGAGVGGIEVGLASAAVLGAFAVTNAGYWGAHVTGASYLEGTSSTVSDSGWYGYIAERGSGADVEYSSSAGHTRSGYNTNANAWLDAHGATDTGSVIGFHADTVSSIAASSTTASGNAWYAYYANTGSFIGATSTEIPSGNDGFYARSQSSIDADGADVAGLTGTAYEQRRNGFVSAVGVTGVTSTSAGDNDTTNFILGL